MIELILIFPLIAGIILLFTRTVKLNIILVMSYAILHLLISFYCGFNSNYKTLTNGVFATYFKIDNLNILFLLILSVVFLGVAIYNCGFVKNRDLHRHDLKYYSLGILIFIFSMTGTVLSTNLELSWVLIEATTLASAYLIYFNKTKHSVEAAWKYVFICSIGIALAFVGIIFLSIATGNLNSLFFDDLYANASIIDPFWLKLSFVFILFGIGTKMGLAPVHFWLPDAHSEAPSPISALLSAALLNSAFLIILKVFKLMKITNVDHYAKILLIVMGILSIFVAAVFIYNIKNYKRMLAYSSIENMGIIAIGTALGGVGIYAALFHMVGHSLIKSSFFLTAGNILKLFETKKINAVSELLKADKTTGWLWILCFIGITGLPPSPLFISEFLLLKALFLKNHFVIVAVLLVLLTVILFGIARIIINMSFGEEKIIKPQINIDAKPEMTFSLYFPQTTMIIIALILGVYIPPFLDTLIKNAISGF